MLAVFMPLSSTQTQPSPFTIPFPCSLHFPNRSAPVSSTSIFHTLTPSPGEIGRIKRTLSSSNSARMGITTSSTSSSKWWWQRALGQQFNREGAASFLSVVAAEPHFALPHLSVPDIRSVDWPALRRLGFCGVVFDKDNTLTAPYSLSLWPPLSTSFGLCCSSFPPGSVVVFSNSAGLKQYDPDGAVAKALEEAIGGVHVIRHGKYLMHHVWECSINNMPACFLEEFGRWSYISPFESQFFWEPGMCLEVKKPAGTAEEIERYFGCPASLLVMVGDRIFTDVVYGNRHGFLTILTDPLSHSEEPFTVKQVRKIERLLVNSWCRQGIEPPKHALMEEAKQCIKAPPF